MRIKNFLKKWTLLLLLATAAISFSSCWRTTEQKIIASKTITDVLTYADKDTLVIFDFDQTLVKQVYEFASGQWFRTKVQKLQAKGISELEAKERIYKIADLLPIHKNPITIVEAAAKRVFEQLRHKKIATIILTARSLKQSKATLKQLHSIGINFDDKLIYEKKLTLDKNNEIGFTDGILFSRGTSKGDVLFRFLDTIGLRPKKILFIDDYLKYIQSVYDKMVERNVPGICLHYQATSIEKDKAKFDFSRADDQLRREFIKHNLDMSIYENAS